MPGPVRMTRARKNAVDAAVEAVETARAAGVDLLVLADALGLAQEATAHVEAAAVADTSAVAAAADAVVLAVAAARAAGVGVPGLEPTAAGAAVTGALATARAVGVDMLSLAAAVVLDGGIPAEARALVCAEGVGQPPAGTKRARDDDGGGGGAASAAEVAAAAVTAEEAVPCGKRVRGAESAPTDAMTTLAKILDAVRLVDDDDDDSSGAGGGGAFAAWKAAALATPGTAVLDTDAELLATAYDDDDDVDSESAAIRALGAFDATETFAHCTRDDDAVEYAEGAATQKSLPHALNDALRAVRILCDVVTGGRSLLSLGFDVFHRIVLGAVIRTMRAMQERIAVFDPLCFGVHSVDTHRRAIWAVGTARSLDPQVHADTYGAIFESEGTNDDVRNNVFFGRYPLTAAATDKYILPSPAHGREVQLFTPSALDALQDVATSFQFGRLAASGISPAFVQLHGASVYRNAPRMMCKIAAHYAHDRAECSDFMYYVRACHPGEDEARAYARMISVMMQVFLALEAANLHFDIFTPVLTPRHKNRGSYAQAHGARILHNVCVHTTTQEIMTHQRPGTTGLCVFPSAGVRVTIGAHGMPRGMIATATASPTANPIQGREVFSGFRELMHPGRGFKGGDLTTTKLEAMQRVMDSNPARAACSIADLFLGDTLGEDAPFALACIDAHECADAEFKLDGDARRPLV